MEIIEKIDINNLLIDEIGIEVEVYGPNDQRFIRNEYEHYQDELAFFFGLEVYHTNDSTDTIIKNIKVWSDYGEVEITNSEYESIHDKLIKSITITNI